MNRETLLMHISRNLHLLTERQLFTLQSTVDTMLETQKNYSINSFDPAEMDSEVKDVLNGGGFDADEVLNEKRNWLKGLR